MTTLNKENHKPNVEFNRRKILARYRGRGGKARKGLFTPTTRKRLLGEIPEGKEELKSKPDLRYHVREQVKTALIDLELFFTMCDSFSENEVVTPENIEPLVTSILLQAIRDGDGPDLKKAEISKLFIKAGFSYLIQMKKKFVNRATKKNIDDALDTTNYLVELFRAPDENRYVSPLDSPRD